MRTIREVLSLSISYLEKRGVKRARLCSEELLAFVLKVKRFDLYLDVGRPLKEEELILFQSYLQRKGAKEPLEYILERISFYNCEIDVKSGVLIPRPETEVLVDKVIEEIEKIDLAGKVLWDIATGSGCIAIAIKKRFENLQVIGTDISLRALDIARRNAEKNLVNVKFRYSDLLSSFGQEMGDFVVCNPPYVSKDEYNKLDEEIKLFEPQEALLGGEDGLDFYRRLARDLPFFLKPKSKIFFEIGANQGNEVQEIFSGQRWAVKKIIADLSGHDRFFFLEIE